MAHGGQRLLMVDADPRVRRALRSLARAAGHETVLEAADADEAGRIADTSGGAQPLVAVVEPMLPDLARGCALIHALGGSGVVVLALSLRPEAGPPALGAGAAVFLTKDCTPEHLLEGIERVLRDPATPRA